MNDATSTEERYSKKVADCQVRVTKKLDGSEIFAELTHFFSLQDSRNFSFIVLSICDWHIGHSNFFLYYVIPTLKLRYSEKATNVLEKYSNLFDVLSNVKYDWEIFFKYLNFTCSLRTA